MLNNRGNTFNTRKCSVSTRQILGYMENGMKKNIEKAGIKEDLVH